MGFKLNIDNILETKIRELNSRGITSVEYGQLYADIGHEKLKTIFSWLHGGFVSLFEILNKRLPTGENSAHFWADPSRELSFIIDITISLQNSLRESKWAFVVDEYYATLIKRCREFLSDSGGSSIPPHMEKVILCYVEPIFRLTEFVLINNEDRSVIANLKPIGNGSYANVFRYTDPFYQKDFVVKRAKIALNEKELQRFKREFEEMKSLHSPYIVEVYSYNEEKHEYTMELMDLSLEKYISRNNQSMTLRERKNIIMQLLRGYGYLHSKGLFHRDISFKNVLLKQYDDTLVVKLSDFGLVKIEESDLTSEDTEFKGSLNDPALKTEGFANYGFLHEVYALTLLFAYVITGKSAWSKIDNPTVKSFVNKGTDHDKTKRFQTLEELGEAVKGCFEALEKQR
ncbi:MAG: protein kinase family protein [Verrucomicrobia bacterium]|nr:protein kinase family protein [Verrucomicrobiota bacterium]